MFGDGGTSSYGQPLRGPCGPADGQPDGQATPAHRLPTNRPTLAHSGGGMRTKCATNPQQAYPNKNSPKTAVNTSQRSRHATELAEHCRRCWRSMPRGRSDGSQNRIKLDLATDRLG